MKRITYKDAAGRWVIACNKFWNWIENKLPAHLRGEAVDRLAAIEEVLGDEYDLDRLRDLVEADSMVGKQLYFTKWFSPGVRIANPPIQRTVTSYSRLRNGVILLHLKDGAFPLRLIGDCAYKTREAAEAAIAKETDHE